MLHLASFKLNVTTEFVMKPILGLLICCRAAITYALPPIAEKTLFSWDETRYL